LTSRSVLAEVLPRTIFLPTLVLSAQAVFLLERISANKQTDATERLTSRRRLCCQR